MKCVFYINTILEVKSLGGGGEIRTHGGLVTSLVFKTSAINRSTTPPSNLLHWRRGKDSNLRWGFNPTAA
jgi:hypothetical protein